MDIYRIIKELYGERERLSHVIGSLESLIEGGGANKPKRRGRKTMSQEERLQVSQRMRKYWEARRKK